MFALALSYQLIVLFLRCTIADVDVTTISTIPLLPFLALFLLLFALSLGLYLGGSFRLNEQVELLSGSTLLDDRRDCHLLLPSPLAYGADFRLGGDGGKTRSSLSSG